MNSDKMINNGNRSDLALTAAVFGERSGVIVGVDVDTFTQVEIIVVATTVVALEFVVSVSNSVDERSDVRMNDTIPDIGVDVLTDANASTVSTAAPTCAASASCVSTS